MIIDTILGKAEILGGGPGNTLFVKMLSWTPEYIEAMGGEKKAWVLISEEQIKKRKEK